MEIVFWHWFGLAVMLVGAEMLVPGAFLLWVGVAAAVTGLILFAMPDLAIEWQILCFSVLAILSVVASRKFLKQKTEDSDDPALNQRGMRLIGQVVTLENAIVNGRGRAQVGDSSWIVTGPDLPVGSKVKITGSDGAILQVEQA